VFKSDIYFNIQIEEEKKIKINLIQIKISQVVTSKYDFLNSNTYAYKSSKPIKRTGYLHIKSPSVLISLCQSKIDLTIKIFINQ